MKTNKLLVLLLLTLCVCPLHAQDLKILGQIERMVAGKTIRSVSVISQQTNAALYKRLAGLFQPPSTPVALPLPKIPQMTNPITFRVQAGPIIHGTASAFAIEKNGRLFGVTAAHVMETIEPRPFMTYQTAPDQFKAIPITSWRRGNPFNSDVAVFEIPEEAKPYVQPLPISQQPLQPKQHVSIAGFARNTPLWLPSEEVLYVGAQRSFIHNTANQSLTGMCGSPIMADGKVTGLYVGYTRGEQSSVRQGWVKMLNKVSSDPLPPMHQISSIDQVFPLVESLENNTPEIEGSVLRVLGYPVTTLGVEDQLFSIEQIRRGLPIKQIYTGPLADPEHMEQFLNLTDNDIVNLSILRKSGEIQTYSINVSTGEVTLREVKQ